MPAAVHCRAAMKPFSPNPSASTAISVYQSTPSPSRLAVRNRVSRPLRRTTPFSRWHAASSTWSSQARAAEIRVAVRLCAMTRAMVGERCVLQMTGKLQNCFSATRVQNRQAMSQDSAQDPAHCPRSWLGAHHDRHERRTRWVVGLTVVMMLAEIAGGYWYGSMALLADGWHMATHAAALGVAALAYRY